MHVEGLNKKVIIGIYKITSPSGRVYIGQTRNYYNRLKDYNSLRSKKQPRLSESFKKHGVDNHIFEILEECEFDQLNIRERYWQDFYNVLGKEGLNCVLTKTDELPTIMSEETRKKISEGNKGKIVLKGKDHPMFGMVVSEEVRQKIKNAVKGKNPMKGKTHSEETKRKISESKKAKNLRGENSPNYGKKYTEERCSNMSKSLKGRKRTREEDFKQAKYILIDVATKEIFAGCAEAARSVGVAVNTIHNIIKGRRPNTTNIILLEDYEEGKEYEIKKDVQVLLVNYKKQL